MKSVYFDNASTSWPKPPGVVSAMTDYMETYGANTGRGINQRVNRVYRVVYETREQLKRLFGAQSDGQVIFTAGITQSINMVLKGYLKPGDHVLTTGMEHNAVARNLHHMEAVGITWDTMPHDDQGNLILEAVAPMISENTVAMVVNHGSNVFGNMVDLEAIGAICQVHGLKLVVDSAQTAGVHEILFNKWHIDALCFTAHKGLLSPQGLGGIIVTAAMGAAMTPILDGGTDSATVSLDMPDFMPDRFEPGTLNIPAIFALHEALRFLERVDRRELLALEHKTLECFLDGLQAMPIYKVVGGGHPNRRCAVVSVDCQGIDAAELGNLLDRNYGIMTRVGLHCAPLAHKTMGTYPRGTIRFSFNHYNTIEEVYYCLDALETIGNMLKEK